jgi:DNA-binding MarR family transcriptional regulator
MGSHIFRRAGARGGSGAASTRQILDAIRRIVQALRESSRAAEKRVGLSGAQLFILRVAAEQPGLSLNDLSERTRTHQSSVSTVVTRLVKDGLVERRTSAGDARRAEVWVSASGRRRLHRAPRAAQESLMDAVESLPQADRARMAALLSQVVDRMALPKRRPQMFFEDGKRKGMTRARHA